MLTKLLLTKLSFKTMKISSLSYHKCLLQFPLELIFVTDGFVPFACYLFSIYKTRRPKWWVCIVCVCVWTISPHISMMMPYSGSKLPPHHSWLGPHALSMLLHLPVNPISPGMTLALWRFLLSKESLLEYINAKTEWPQTHSSLLLPFILDIKG